MRRIVEPEIMEDVDQAKAYDGADFSSAHNRRVDVFRQLAPPKALKGLFLDLGCGSGDLDFRLLNALPECSIIGVDGSRAMIELAREATDRHPELHGRASFIEAFIPSDALPKGPYNTVMSNSFLHHLHEPLVLWETIKQVATPDTFIFVSDLRRPESAEEARRIVEELAGDEAEILKRDFFNSLCAAFEVPEVDDQLARAGIAGLKVQPLDDIHLIVHGFMRYDYGGTQPETSRPCSTVRPAEC
jgi:SAM-dependent methyltransferase